MVDMASTFSAHNKPWKKLLCDIATKSRPMTDRAAVSGDRCHRVALFTPTKFRGVPMAHRNTQMPLISTSLKRFGKYTVYVFWSNGSLAPGLVSPC